MYIYLPDAKVALACLVDRMCSEHDFLDKYVPCSELSLREFKIPKFKFNYQHELSKDLKSMGLELRFRPGGLMEMVTDPEAGKLLFVSNSFIEVNEEGTEAAAVTAAVLMGCARRLDMEYDLDFVADHPFAFVIRENTTNIVQKLDVH